LTNLYIGVLENVQLRMFRECPVSVHVKLSAHYLAYVHRLKSIRLFTSQAVY